MRISNPEDMVLWLREYNNKRINSKLMDERRCIPPYIVMDFGNHGIFGMQVPREHGGLAFNTSQSMRVLEQLGAIDLMLALLVGLNNGLGIRSIQHFATAEVRDQYLPLLAEGRILSSFALTEPGAGSNPKALHSKAIPQAGGGWKLWGTKNWIGSAAWSTLIAVFARLEDPNAAHSSISSFIMRQGSEGLRIGTEAMTMGMRGLVQNQIHMEGVHVEEKYVLGDLEDGMGVAQNAMTFGRLILSAISLGGMKHCAQLMLRYARRRSIITGGLLENPVSQVLFSEVTAKIQLIESIVEEIADLVDQEATIPREIYALSKTISAEFLWQTADSLVQLLGGRGYSEVNIASRMLRDARIFRIFEGPSEALNMYLGSKVINRSRSFYQFMNQTLGAEAISERLKSVAQTIREQSRSTTSPFSEKTTSTQWAYSLTGHVAMEAVALAFLEKRLAKHPRASHMSYTLEWARMRFENAIQQNVNQAPHQQMIVNPMQTIDIISSYSEGVGNLEQTLSGEESELDTLLQQEAEVTHT